MAGRRGAADQDLHSSCDATPPPLAKRRGLRGQQGSRRGRGAGGRVRPRAGESQDATRRSVPVLLQ